MLFLYLFIKNYEKQLKKISESYNREKNKIPAQLGPGKQSVVFTPPPSLCHQSNLLFRSRLCSVVRGPARALQRTRWPVGNSCTSTLKKARCLSWVVSHVSWTLLSFSVSIVNAALAVINMPRFQLWPANRPRFSAIEQGCGFAVRPHWCSDCPAADAVTAVSSRHPGLSCGSAELDDKHTLKTVDKDVLLRSAL